MITGFIVLLILLVPSVFPKSSNCGVLHVAGKILSGSNDFNLISHAFVQTENELHYFRDVSSQEVAFVNKSPEITREFELEFEPKQLEFEASFLGIPRRIAVTVYNPNKEAVIIHAISSKNIDFYFSFPEDKVIKPEKESKFIVTFLPRKEGKSESVLSIHTSAGIFLYNVIGHADGNPYRIQPTTKARLPINGTFEFPIYLHNPHPDKLRVANAFSSHAELVLMHKRSNLQIDIAPFETLNIAQAIISGATERNMTVFVMIKMDLLAHDGQPKLRDIQLVLAVDLDVASKRGLFSTSDVLDFGLIKYGERSKRLIFNAYSTVEKGVEIDSVYVDKSNVPTNGIYMQFASKPPIPFKCKSKSQPGTPVPIANVEIDTSFLSLNKSQKIHHISGEIVAESRGGNYNATVKFKAVVFIGEILHTLKDASFHSGVKLPARQSVSLQNNYPFGVAIWNVSISKEAQSYFKVSLLRPVVEIAPNKTNPVLLIDYIKKARTDFITTCTLFTNVTNFEFSILIFNGEISIKIHSSVQKKQFFDFGLVKPGTQRTMFFSVVNPNPVVMSLRNLDTPLEKYIKITPIEMQSLENANSKNIERGINTFDWTRGMDFPMLANSVLHFNLSIFLPPHTKTVKQLTLNVNTYYKHYELPIKYELTNASINFLDKKLDLGESFPGKIASKEIRVYSSFDENLRVLGLSVYNKDPRFFFRLKSHSELSIAPKTITSLGQIRFSSSLACTSNCYAGFPLHTADGQWFNYGLKLPQNLAEIDSYLYSRLRRRFDAIQNKNVQQTLLLDTEKAKSFDVQVETKLTWPRLFSHPVVHFPLTAVGNFSILNLTLTNPSIHPVIVQLLPLVIYPDAEALLDFFHEEFSFPIPAPVEMNETLMFSLRDTELFTLKPTSPVPKLREELEKVVGGPVPRFTLSMMLKPGMSVRVRIGFLPTDYTLRSSLLLIRNNLTAIEPVVLYGKGAHINMEIDGKPARGDYLLFDILPVHLTDCHNPKRLTHKLPTTLTVKRSFIVKNKGEVKFTVTTISISGTPCKDRGFRVLNCKPFTLAPNQTHTLDIAYTPDFLMSVNEATLQLMHHMNGTPWSYDMVATVSPEMLSVCHAALPRPPFEWVMYYSVMFALVFCMICVVSCAYLEGDRFITSVIQQQPDNLSEKDGLTTQLKTDTAEVQSNEKEVQDNVIYRLFFGPRDQHYLSVFAFGTDPLSKIAEKCCNYVIWIFANILLAIRGEPVRNSTSKRNKRNRRRIAPTSTDNDQQVTSNVSQVEQSAPKTVAQSSLGRISNFSDSISSTKSQEEGYKSVAESSQSGSGIKKRKNVSKKHSNENQSEPAEIKPKPVIKVSAIQKEQEMVEIVVEIQEPKVEEASIVEEPISLSAKSSINLLESSDQASVEMGPSIDDDNPNSQDFDQVEMSDSSGVPEWADTTIVQQGNLNDEFDEMVKQSSDLFGRSTSVMSNSSHLSQSDNIQPGSSAEDKKRKRRTKKKKTDMPMHPSMKWLTKKEINRLTNEYKLQLEAMANNVRYPGIVPPIQFVPPQFIQPGFFPQMPTPFMPLTHPDSYNEFMRMQLQYQREQNIQQQMFQGQRAQPPNQQIQGSPIPWSVVEQKPSTSANPSNNNLFNSLSSDLFKDIEGNLQGTSQEEPLRASSSFFDSLSKITNVEDDGNNQFLSLYSDDEDHIWKPIDESENKSSLWPNMNDIRKKEE